jgi:lactoylglutathione lyase
MKLGYVLLYVSDVTRSVEFYEAAFGLQRRFLHESGDYAEMETGPTALGFVQADFMKSGGTPFRSASPGDLAPAFEVGLVTSHVEEAYARALEAGASGVATPHAKPWGQVVSYVRDLDGFLVELCTEVKP